MSNEPITKPSLTREKFTFISDFDLREVVNIDGDVSISATIICVAFYDGRTQYQCAYMNNGAAQEPWIDRWRLTRCSRFVQSFE